MLQVNSEAPLKEDITFDLIQVVKLLIVKTKSGDIEWEKIVIPVPSNLIKSCTNEFVKAPTKRFLCKYRGFEFTIVYDDSSGSSKFVIRKDGLERSYELSSYYLSEGSPLYDQYRKRYSLSSWCSLLADVIERAGNGEKDLFALTRKWKEELENGLVAKALPEAK